MGNAEKAAALSLAAHMLLAAGAAAILERSFPKRTEAALDVSSVELSLADNDSTSVTQDSPASASPNERTQPAPPVDEPPPMEALKVSESVPAPGTVEIPLLRESVEMRFEKTLAQPSPPVSGAEQAHVEAPASPKRNITPRYPRSSRLRGEEGLVRLELTIDAFGAVAGVSVAVSSGFKELDQAAVRAVKAAIFNPASRNGRNIESTIGLTFVFRLK
jgi:protein TonB